MELIKLFLVFFKIGTFTIGGGYAMIPLIREEVISNGWVTAESLVDFIAISESTPGPFAINLATFAGIHSAGFWGAVLATLGIVTPSFLIVLAISKWVMSFRESFYVSAALRGLRGAVIGLILSAGALIAKEAFWSAPENGGFWGAISPGSILIFAAAFFLYKKLKLHPIIIILISGALGILFLGAAEVFA